MAKTKNLLNFTSEYGAVISRAEKPSHLKKGGSYWLVRCKCGSERVLDAYSIKNRWRSCGCDYLENLIGKEYHYGVVRELVGFKNGHRIWKLECKCGNFYTAKTESLNSHNTKSCGCFNERSGKDHPHYKGCGDLSGNYWGEISRNAKKRGLTLEIDIEYAWELFVSQNKKCALTGWDIYLSDSRLHAEQTASLDRVNSDYHYVKGNVQWVHKDVNCAKLDYTEDYFFSICEAVVNKRRLSLD